MTKKKEGTQTDATFKKEERAKDGAAAMLEYEGGSPRHRGTDGTVEGASLAKEAAERNAASRATGQSRGPEAAAGKIDSPEADGAFWRPDALVPTRPASQHAGAAASCRPAPEYRQDDGGL